MEFVETVEQRGALQESWHQSVQRLVLLEKLKFHYGKVMCPEMFLHLQQTSLANTYIFLNA